MGIELKHKKTEFYVSLGAAVLGTIACALVSIMGGYVTFAWFTANRTASGTASNLVVGKRDTVASVTVYPYQTITSPTDGVQTFSKTASTTNNLGNYSILKQTGNSILLEATLTSYAQSQSTFDVSAHSDATVYLGALDSTTGKLKQPLQLTGNSLSSIVDFYAFRAASIVDSGGYYSVTLANTINPTGQKMSFVSSNAIVADQSICTITESVTKFYFILDYDIDQIEAIYSANIGNSDINDVSNMASDGQSYLTYTTDFYFWINAYTNS
jgi:hypothetical protein